MGIYIVHMSILNFPKGEKSLFSTPSWFYFYENRKVDIVAKAQKIKKKKDK